MIVFVDQVVWRPLVAWSHKFTDEETTADPVRGLGTFAGRESLAGGSQSWSFFQRRVHSPAVATATHAATPGALRGERAALDQVVSRAAFGAGVLVGAVNIFHLLMTLTGGEWLHLLP